MPTQPIVDFLNRVVSAFGVTATVQVEETADGPRFNLTGDEAELFVRHRGEPLKALQQIVDSCYGRSLDGEKRVFVDALEYRKGKDIELRNMAKFLAGKAKESGLDQQLGPLRPRRVDDTPAEPGGNWTWRAPDWGFRAEDAERLRRMAVLSGRYPSRRE